MKHCPLRLKINAEPKRVGQDVFDRILGKTICVLTRKDDLGKIVSWGYDAVEICVQGELTPDGAIDFTTTDELVEAVEKLELAVFFRIRPLLSRDLPGYQGKVNFRGKQSKTNGRDYATDHPRTISYCLEWMEKTVRHFRKTKRLQGWLICWGGWGDALLWDGGFDRAARRTWTEWAGEHHASVRDFPPFPRSLPTTSQWQMFARFRNYQAWRFTRLLMEKVRECDRNHLVGIFYYLMKPCFGLSGHDIAFPLLDRRVDFLAGGGIAAGDNMGHLGYAMDFKFAAQYKPCLNEGLVCNMLPEANYRRGDVETLVLHSYLAGLHPKGLMFGGHLSDACRWQARFIRKYSFLAGLGKTNGDILLVIPVHSQSATVRSPALDNPGRGGFAEILGDDISALSDHPTQDREFDILNNLLLSLGIRLDYLPETLVSGEILDKYKLVLIYQSGLSRRLAKALRTTKSLVLLTGWSGLAITADEACPESISSDERNTLKSIGLDCIVTPRPRPPQWWPVRLSFASEENALNRGLAGKKFPLGTLTPYQDRMILWDGPSKDVLVAAEEGNLGKPIVFATKNIIVIGFRLGNALENICHEKIAATGAWNKNGRKEARYLLQLFQNILDYAGIERLFDCSTGFNLETFRNRLFSCRVQTTTRDEYILIWSWGERMAIKRLNRPPGSRIVDVKSNRPFPQRKADSIVLGKSPRLLKIVRSRTGKPA